LQDAEPHEWKSPAADASLKAASTLATDDSAAECQLSPADIDQNPRDAWRCRTHQSVETVVSLARPGLLISDCRQLTYQNKTQQDIQPAVAIAHKAHLELMFDPAARYLNALELDY
jgi:hypothetical protein